LGEKEMVRELCEVVQRTRRDFLETKQFVAEVNLKKAYQNQPFTNLKGRPDT